MSKAFPRGSKPLRRPRVWRSLLRAGPPLSEILASLRPSSLENGSVRRVGERQGQNLGLTLPSLGTQRQFEARISAEFAAETATILRRRPWRGISQTDWLAAQCDANRSLTHISRLSRKNREILPFWRVSSRQERKIPSDQKRIRSFCHFIESGVICAASGPIGR